MGAYSKEHRNTAIIHPNSLDFKLSGNIDKGA